MGYHQLKADIEKLESEIEVLNNDWAITSLVITNLASEDDEGISAQFRIIAIRKGIAKKKVAMKEKELEVAQLDLEGL